MAARGGRGGGRGGGGGGRGANNMPVGHLLYADIIAQTKEMKDELYPKVETVQTEWPTDREAEIAKRYYRNMQDLKLTPFYVKAATGETSAVPDRFSDRFKTKAVDRSTLADLHKYRQWDKALHPAASFEALLVDSKKRKRSRMEGRARENRKVRLDDVADEDGAQGEDGEGEDSEGEEDPELLEDEEEEDGNDYEMDYFDNGEDDDFDALGGGGGGGGGDDDGGYF